MERGDEIDVADRVAIVTGGNSGIGREAALQLCRVYLDPARWSSLKRVCFQESD